MSPQTREALAAQIRSRLSKTGSPAADHDVVIVGGGVAALTLALEIRQLRPSTRIVVVEPNTHPVPEVTHTAGSRPSRCRRTTCGIAWRRPTT